MASISHRLGVTCHLQSNMIEVAPRDDRIQDLIIPLGCDLLETPVFWEECHRDDLHDTRPGNNGSYVIGVWWVLRPMTPGGG